MSVLSSVQISSPVGRTEECARFVIEDERERYTLCDVMDPGLNYTLSFWVKSEADGELLFLGKSVPTTTEWTNIVHQFAAEDVNIVFDFEATGTYYIYHAQLEVGDVSTDWSVSPEDVETLAKDAQATAKDAQSSADEADERLSRAESLIEQLGNQISMLVVDGSGRSQMVQTSDGWKFSIDKIQNAVKSTSDDLNALNSQFGNTKETVDALNTAVKDFEDIAEYVKIGIYEDEPCIELGDPGDSKFKLLITNTRIMFTDGSNTPTYIDTDSLMTENITVEHELRQSVRDSDNNVLGNFVWTTRPNGNYGLMWKGV